MNVATVRAAAASACLNCRSVSSNCDTTQRRLPACSGAARIVSPEVFKFLAQSGENHGVVDHDGFSGDHLRASATSPRDVDHEHPMIDHKPHIIAINRIVIAAKSGMIDHLIEMSFLATFLFSPGCAKMLKTSGDTFRPAPHRYKLRVSKSNDARPRLSQQSSQARNVRNRGERRIEGGGPSSLVPRPAS
jgi:hypothetical protein